MVGVVAVLAVLECDFVVEQEVKLVVLPVVDGVDFVLDPLAGASPAGLGVLFGRFLEDLGGLVVDEVHDAALLLEGYFAMLFEHFLDVEEDVLGQIALGLAFPEVGFPQVVVADRGDDLDDIDEPVSQLYVELLEGS